MQLELVALIRPDSRKETYYLVKDVETRWNSFYNNAKRALYLQPAIDELLLKEQGEYNEYIECCYYNKRTLKNAPPPILKDRLNADNWNIIKIYHEILKPLKDATLLLQGHASGRCSAIWQVIPAYEKVLQHLEIQVNQYPVTELLRLSPTQPLLSPIFNPDLDHVANAVYTQADEQTTHEHHLSTNINLA